MRSITIQLLLGSVLVQAGRLNQRTHSHLHSRNHLRDQKSLSERAEGLLDTHVSRDILEQATKDIDNDDDNKFEFLPNGKMKMIQKEEAAFIPAEL